MMDDGSQSSKITYNERLTNVGGSQKSGKFMDKDYLTDYKGFKITKFFQNLMRVVFASLIKLYPPLCQIFIRKSSTFSFGLVIRNNSANKFHLFRHWSGKVKKRMAVYEVAGVSN